MKRGLNTYLGLILLLLACSTRKEIRVEGSQVKMFEFLNSILRDTSLLKYNESSPLFADFVYFLPPPIFDGREIDFASRELSEPDTTFLRKQFIDRKTFKTDSLVMYGFRIIKVSEIRTNMSEDSFWDYVHEKYGDGYYSVSRPIFNKTHNKAYIKLGYSCGSLCGYGSSYILKKENGKWMIEEFLGFWES